MDPVRAIAEAVLYEGYLLWPYRRSALKNRQRWTFGGVYPGAWSRRHADDPSQIQTQCLLEGDAGARLHVEVRFLHVVRRRVARATAGGFVFLDALTVAGTRHLSWEEATERVATATGLRVGALRPPHHVGIDVAEGQAEEPLDDPPGVRVGAIVRSWQALRGAVQIAARPAGDRLFRVTVGIENTTTWDGDDRAAAVARAFVSTHTILRAEGGGFVSLIDPPPARREPAAACRNVGTWPVLVGDEGSHDTMLASPIVLYDHPRVAPESPGDLFDATEIDQLLVLNVLSLTATEQQEMRDSDPRARAILERCAGLSAEQQMRLHGAIRELRPLDEA